MVIYVTVMVKQERIMKEELSLSCLIMRSCGKVISGIIIFVYAEFVVYDVSQVKMRYLVKLKFHFK